MLKRFLEISREQTIKSQILQTRLASNGKRSVPRMVQYGAHCIYIVPYACPLLLDSPLCLPVVMFTNQLFPKHSEPLFPPPTGVAKCDFGLHSGATPFAYFRLAPWVRARTAKTTSQVLGLGELDAQKDFEKIEILKDVLGLCMCLRWLPREVLNSCLKRNQKPLLLISSYIIS